MSVSRADEWRLFAAFLSHVILLLVPCARGMALVGALHFVRGGMRVTRNGLVVFSVGC